MTYLEVPVHGARQPSLAPRSTFVLNPLVNVEIKVESVEVTGISVPVHPYVPRLRSILHQAKSAVEIRSDSRFR